MHIVHTVGHKLNNETPWQIHASTPRTQKPESFTSAFWVVRHCLSPSVYPSVITHQNVWDSNQLGQFNSNEILKRRCEDI